MAFAQFAELWKLIDLLVRKDFRQANLVPVRAYIFFLFLQDEVPPALSEGDAAWGNLSSRFIFSALFICQSYLNRRL